MKKEELISAVGKVLNASGKDETIAFDIFLRKITDKLDVEGVLKVPEIGIFQLSRFRPGPQPSQPESGQSLYINVIPQAESQPGNVPGIITLPASKKLNDSDFDDSFFSLSVDQPLIPVADSRKSEFIVQSNYARMQREFEDIADNLISKSIPLEDFNLFRYQTEEYAPADSGNLNDFVEPETDNSPVSWDFSAEPEEIKAAPPEKPDRPKPLDPEFEMIGDLLDPDEIEPFMDETGLNEPEISDALNPDPFADENIVISEDVPSEDISINLDLDSYDDLLSSPDEPGADEFGLADDAAGNEEEDLNKKLDLLMGMSSSGREVDFQYDDEFLAEDADEAAEENTAADDAAFSQLLAEAGEEINGEEEQPEFEEETIEESEPEPQPAQAAVPPAAEEMVQLSSRKKIGSVVFWLAAASFILLTSVSTYYFLFMRGKSHDQNTAAAAEQEAAAPVEIVPEVIERSNDVPVTAVIAAPEESNNAGAQEEKPLSAGSEQAAQQQTMKPENEAAKQNAVPPPVDNSKKQSAAQIPGKTAAQQDLNAKKAAEEKQNKPAAGINAAQPGNAKSNVSVPSDKKTADAAASPAGTEETYRNLFRNDYKDKMVKSNIFTDGNKFAIQMSSWPQVAKAAAEVNKYKGMGYQAYIVKFKLKNDKPWYRVRIGDFSNINEAEAVVARLK